MKSAVSPNSKKSEPICCVFGCKSRNDGRTYHLFPKEKNVKQNWLDALKFEALKLEDNKARYVCSKHFQNSDFTNGKKRMLKKSAVPSLKIVIPPNMVVIPATGTNDGNKTRSGRVPKRKVPFDEIPVQAKLKKQGEVENKELSPKEVETTKDAPPNKVETKDSPKKKVDNPKVVIEKRDLVRIVVENEANSKNLLKVEVENQNLPKTTVEKKNLTKNATKITSEKKDSTKNTVEKKDVTNNAVERKNAINNPIEKKGSVTIEKNDTSEVQAEIKNKLKKIFKVSKQPKNGSKISTEKINDLTAVFIKQENFAGVADETNMQESGTNIVTLKTEPSLAAKACITKIVLNEMASANSIMKMLPVKKNVSRCVVPNCGNFGGHVFPKSPPVRKKWIDFVGIKNWKPEDLSIICTKHFESKDYFFSGEMKGHLIKKLKPNSVPSIRITNEISMSDNIDKEQNTSPNIILNNQIQAKKVTQGQTKFTVTSKTVDVQGISKNLISKHFPMLKEKVLPKPNQKVQVIPAPSTVSKVPLIAMPAGSKQNTSCQTSRMKLLSAHDLKHNAKAVFFYTGFKCYDQFQEVLTSLGPDAYDLQYFYNEKPEKVDPIDQFLMTLIILRQHKTHFEMSVLFDVTLKDVKNIFITWVRFMRLEWNNFYLPLWTEPKEEAQKEPMVLTLQARPPKPLSKIRQPTPGELEKLQKFYKILVGERNYIENHLIEDINFICLALYNLRVYKVKKT